VKDNGRGIPPEALPKIFKPFFTTRKEGTGLGLSLANGIVQSHGGTIEARSTPGQGTQFRIHLPIARPKTRLPKSAGASGE
jgi:signal transduction histidine kinase